MRFAPMGHERRLSSCGWRRAKKPRKELDMLTSVIVNYNSVIKVHLSGSAPAVALAREQKRNELLEENEI
jgi:hypothetical protein